jgi:hypothetical protein
MNDNRQRKAALQDEGIHNERNKQYLGTARIGLSHLQAESADGLRPRQFHPVSALISGSELNESFKLSCKTSDDLRSKAFPPKLNFHPSKQLKCLNGRPKGDDWWVVDLYSDGSRPVHNVSYIAY